MWEFFAKAHFSASDVHCLFPCMKDTKFIVICSLFSFLLSFFLTFLNFLLHLIPSSPTELVNMRFVTLIQTSAGALEMSGPTVSLFRFGYES
jgi:hypothetical protein